jgi:hypothetical protein
MRTMYDAVTARNILDHDATPQLVAGYVDRIKLAPWTAADWALFPDAVKVRIVKKAGTNDGHVLDVEPGDATPAEAPVWVRMRRKAGADPSIYVNKSTWAAVQAEFVRQNEPQPHYWIAHYNGDPTLPTLNGITAVAKQHTANFRGVDINSVADYWPGVDGPAHSNTGGGTPSGATRTEEDTVDLQAGTNQSRSFDIPSWARQIRVNCPEGFITVHAVFQAGDKFPKTAKDGVPDFDWKWSHEDDFRVDRLRPWWIDVADGATQGSIRWTSDPAHPERTASLSFR